MTATMVITFNGCADQAGRHQPEGMNLMASPGRGDVRLIGMMRAALVVSMMGVSPCIELVGERHEETPALCPLRYALPIAPPLALAGSVSLGPTPTWMFNPECVKRALRTQRERRPW